MKILKTSPLYFMQNLCSVVSLMIIIGTIFIYSASAIIAHEHIGDDFLFIKKQLFGIFLSCCAIIVIQYIPATWMERYAFIILCITIGITGCTMIPRYGIRIHGATRWVRFFTIMFQPSEFLKVSLVTYIASYLNRKNITNRASAYLYLPLSIMMVIISILLLLQPDFGLTVTLISTTLFMVSIAYYNQQHVLYCIVSLATITTALIAYKPYRLARIITFLDPWKDPHGRGFQIIQSLIAIGSGGWFGKGFGNSHQKLFYLPMQHTDFIFSVIAEETGFIGSGCIIGLYLLFLYLGIRIAYSCTSRFAYFFSLGFIFLINLQAIINLLVVTGLAPTKGCGLPFMSYGNSALLSHCIMLGILIALIRDQEKNKENNTIF